MTLKQFHIILDIIIAIVVIVVIISLIAGRDSGGHYYQDAQKAYLKAEQAAASWDISDPGKLYKLSGLYRKVFGKYPDSRWADDALPWYGCRAAYGLWKNDSAAWSPNFQVG